MVGVGIELKGCFCVGMCYYSPHSSFPLFPPSLSQYPLCIHPIILTSLFWDRLLRRPNQVLIRIRPRTRQCIPIPIHQCIPVPTRRFILIQHLGIIVGRSQGIHLRLIRIRVCMLRSVHSCFDPSIDEYNRINTCLVEWLSGADARTVLATTGSRESNHPSFPSHDVLCVFIFTS